MSFTSMKQSGSWCHCWCKAPTESNNFGHGRCSFSRMHMSIHYEAPTLLEVDILTCRTRGQRGTSTGGAMCMDMCIVPSVQFRKQNPMHWNGKHAGSFHKMIMAQIIATTLFNNIAFFYFHVIFSFFCYFLKAPTFDRTKENGTIHSTPPQIVGLIRKHI